LPLFLAALVSDRLPQGAAGWRLRPLQLGSHRVPWTELVAGVMFLAIAAGALYLAVTGQMSYSPGWLTAWNRWATGVAADVAVAVGGIPVLIQAAVLVALAAGIALLIYGPRRPSESPS